MSEEIRTRDQQFAAEIYEQLIKLEKKEPWVKDYGRLANDLPILVKRAGLAQALSFAAKDEKDKEGRRQLLDDLQEVIRKVGGRKDLDLRRESLTADLSVYLLLTQQVMTALHWYKRFAQSVLDVKPGDEGRP